MASITSETGDLRSGDEFEFTCNPNNRAASTFAALTSDDLLVTRRATALFDLPDDTPVLAHWHGQYRTDGFGMTVGMLKAKAVLWAKINNDPKALQQIRDAIRTSEVAAIDDAPTISIPNREAAAAFAAGEVEEQPRRY